MAPTTSPFLALPAEIRLQIYSHLLAPHVTSTKQCMYPVHPSAEYHSYNGLNSEVSALDMPNVLRMRIIDPQNSAENTWAVDVLPTLRRTKCLIRTDRFRNRTMQTTYTATNNPGIAPEVLATCRQIHAEAAEVLYTSYTFDFDAHVEAIGAFLNDLTPLSKSFIRSVGIVKRATPYDRDFDRCEWSSATLALSTLSSLRTLHLGVVAGKPGVDGWDGVPDWRKEDFESMVKWRAWAGFEWVRELSRVKVAGEVKMRAIVEHCPMPSSEGMMFWVGVSRNVEGGFGEWVRALVLEHACAE